MEPNLKISEDLNDSINKEITYPDKDPEDFECYSDYDEYCEQFYDDDEEPPINTSDFDIDYIKSLLENLKLSSN